MNIKRIFGALLTVLGTISLIYAAISFVNNPGEHTKSLITYSLLGLIFFIAGISLIRTIKDEG